MTIFCGVIEILVVEGKNLKTNDFITKSSPFIKIIGDPGIVRTKTMEYSGSNALWNEILKLNVLPGTEKLKIECWDDAIIDKLLSSTTITLADVFKTGTLDLWVKLYTIDSKELAGELRLVLTFKSKNVETPKPFAVKDGSSTYCGVAEILVVEGKYLHTQETLAKTSPFLKIIADGGIIRTKTVNYAGNHVVWNEPLRLNVLPGMQALRLECWDDQIIDRQLSSAIFTLDTVFKVGAQDTWVTLRTTSDNKYAGEVRIVMYFRSKTATSPKSFIGASEPNLSTPEFGAPPKLLGMNEVISPAAVSPTKTPLSTIQDASLSNTPVEVVVEPIQGTQNILLISSVKKTIDIC
ncbi:C2 domain-containing protein [Globomyces pollinis-pini]|nr:C2 domain-containing protein [Globomyces pollinis-pini]